MAANNTSMTLLLITRSLRLRIQRVLVVFAALMVGAAIITAMAGVYFDINEKMSHELRNYGANFFVGPEEGKSYLDDDGYKKMMSLAPQGSLVASSPYLYGMAQSDLENVVLMGIDFSQLRKLVPYWQVKGKWIGVSFDERNVMIGSKLAEKLELSVGSTINLIKKNGETRSFTIKGIIESGSNEDNYLILNLPVVQNWLNKESKINYAMFSLANDQGQVSEFQKKVSKVYPALNVRPIRKVSASEGRVLDKIKLLLGVVSLVILILSTLCVNTTLTAMISERRREFALQKSLGASNKAITGQIIIETVLITIVAIIVGLGVGYVLAQILGQTVFNASIDLRLPVFLITPISSIIAAVVAAILPTVRAINVNPAKVLKGE